MEKPTSKDLGRVVIYQAHDEAEPEEGTLVNFDDTTGFVRFSHNDSSIQGCNLEDLRFALLDFG